MITILNDDLFSFEHKSGMDRRTGTQVSKLVVSTSNKLVRYARDNKRKKTGNDIDMSGTPRLISTSREILSVTTPVDKSEEWNKLPISISVTDNEQRIPQVNIRCIEERDNRRNANIYVLAIPFNGMIQPIPEDPTYRIYKGMMGNSQRPIYFNGRRYRKVLYLVIEPNMQLLNPEHKHHVREIVVSIQSFAVYKDKETGDDKTNHETYTFKICDAEGMYTENWEYETLDRSVIIEANHNDQLWHTFRFTQKDRPGTNGNRRPFNKGTGKPEGYIQGNTLITRNKNGIRKEVALDKRGHARAPKDIDTMMKESGMFDHDDYGGNRKGNRNKNGKKGKRRK